MEKLWGEKEQGRLAAKEKRFAEDIIKKKWKENFDFKKPKRINLKNPANNSLTKTNRKCGWLMEGKYESHWNCA